MPPPLPPALLFWKLELLTISLVFSRAAMRKFVAVSVRGSRNEAMAPPFPTDALLPVTAPCLLRGNCHCVSIRVSSASTRSISFLLAVINIRPRQVDLSLPLPRHPQKHVQCVAPPKLSTIANAADRELSRVTSKGEANHAMQ